MKTIFKKLFRPLVPFLLSAVLLVTGISITAFAGGTVTYDGSAQKFIFEPGSEYSPTDLFSDFKDVMPGDSITQTVLIKNPVENDVKINLYMRSLGAQEGSEGFLSQLKLKVSQSDKYDLFEAPASETAQLTDWVFLGTYYAGAETTLNITLDVPITLGNEYQDAIGYLDWQFRVEEFPISPEDPKPPKTGDTTNIYLYYALAGMSVLTIFFLLLRKPRKAAEEDS